MSLYVHGVSFLVRGWDRCDSYMLVKAFMQAQQEEERQNAIHNAIAHFAQSPWSVSTRLTIKAACDIFLLHEAFMTLANVWNKLAKLFTEFTTDGFESTVQKLADVVKKIREEFNPPAAIEPQHGYGLPQDQITIPNPSVTIITQHQAAGASNGMTAATAIGGAPALYGSFIDFIGFIQGFLNSTTLNVIVAASRVSTILGFELATYYLQLNAMLQVLQNYFTHHHEE